MKPRDIGILLDQMIVQGNTRPIILIGKPGGGKTSVVRQCAARNEMEFLPVHLAQMEPTDLIGLPFAQGGKTVHLTPGILPTKGRGILFLDEFAQSTPMMMNAASELLLERKLGHYHMPDGWLVWCASNRRSDRAGVNEIPSHVKNRWYRIDYDTDLDDWAGWAVQNGVVNEVLAFIQWRPALLHDFDPNKDCFPTPRSWEMVSDAMKMRLPMECLQGLVMGAVGEGACAEFLGYQKVFNQIPDVEDCIKNPKTATVPKAPDILYALCTCLSSKADHSNIGNILKYSERLPVEFVVMIVKDCLKRDETLVKTKGIGEWVEKNQSALS